MVAVDRSLNNRITIRSPNDPQLLEGVKLGITFWDESPIYRGMQKDVDLMIAYGYNARESDEDYCKVAIDNRDNVIGFFVGSIAPYGFHCSTFAYDRLLYINPNKRGGIAASKLIRDFEEWAKAKGASRIMLGITTGIHTERTERLYNVLGYDTVGKLTMKEI